MDINTIGIDTVVAGTKIVLMFLPVKDDPDFVSYSYGSTELVLDQIIKQLDRRQKEGKAVVYKGQYYFPKNHELYPLWEGSIAWRLF